MLCSVCPVQCFAICTAILPIGFSLCLSGSLVSSMAMISMYIMYTVLYIQLKMFQNLDNLTISQALHLKVTLAWLVRKSSCPLQQVIRRISESSANSISQSVIPGFEIVKKRHNRGHRLMEYIEYAQFEEV